MPVDFSFITNSGANDEIHIPVVKILVFNETI